LVSLQSWAKSDIGRKRAANEDSLFEDAELGLFMVADGMGGHRGGDRASRIAVLEASASFKEAVAQRATIATALEDAMKIAASKVYHMGLTHQELRGMGTTLSALAVNHERVLIAHIGDTRIYCLRENYLHQLTTDHSLVNEQVLAGVMTKEEARVSSLRNIITRAIGHDERVNADFLTFSIEKNDVFLLCTDGLNNMLSDTEITSIISTFEPALAVDKLVHEANQKGGDDNISVILVRIAA
jgi:protein phosphatase